MRWCGGIQDTKYSIQNTYMTNDRHLFGILFLILVFDIWLYTTMFSFYFSQDLKVYFLSVGQGDSTLLVMPSGKRFIIDGGPSAKLVSEISGVLPPWVRRIDGILATHPQKDHFAGFINLLDSYRVDYMFGNGDREDTETWQIFEKKLQENNLIPIVLRTGDRIEGGGVHMNVLSPHDDVEVAHAKDKNDPGVVMRVEYQGKSFLFTADVPKEVLTRLPQEKLAVDVLKVPHHGSKTGLDEELISKIHPIISVIEVGKNNYGHPKKEIVNLLFAHTQQLLRTDKERPKITVTNKGVLDIDMF